MEEEKKEGNEEEAKDSVAHRPRVACGWSPPGGQLQGTQAPRPCPLGAPGEAE